MFCKASHVCIRTLQAVQVLGRQGQAWRSMAQPKRRGTTFMTRKRGMGPTGSLSVCFLGFHFLEKFCIELVNVIRAGVGIIGFLIFAKKFAFPHIGPDVENNCQDDPPKQHFRKEALVCGITCRHDFGRTSTRSNLRYPGT
mmetsp:Transcript_11214/g.19570  ORF Transcript_11214/g.19570 Transcript_11214/m.19570 type:complete len:141 (-) Transcript_11214:22-444(-)